MMIRFFFSLYLVVLTKCVRVNIELYPQKDLHNKIGLKYRIRMRSILFWITSSVKLKALIKLLIHEETTKVWWPYSFILYLLSGMLSGPATKVLKKNIFRPAFIIMAKIQNLTDTTIVIKFCYDRVVSNTVKLWFLSNKWYTLWITVSMKKIINLSLRLQKPPFTWKRLTKKIRAWVYCHIHPIVQDVITHSFLNFNGVLTKPQVRTWMSIYISLFNVDVITDPCLTRCWFSLTNIWQ